MALTCLQIRSAAVCLSKTNNVAHLAAGRAADGLATLHDDQQEAARSRHFEADGA